MAVGAAIVVVLAVTVAAVIRPSSGNGLVTPRLVLTPSPGPGGTYVQVAVPGPVARDERVALTGDGGTRVEVGTRLHLEQPSLDHPDQRLVFFKVHLHNTGTSPVLARLATDAWVIDSTGARHQGDHMRSQMLDMSADTPQLRPGFEVDLTAGFPVPSNARLIRLHVELPIGGSTPSAEWNLR